ncbi:putative L-asparaginase [Luteitalea pratensis]|uniref:Putative L-asparaginase n=1 Tax=Luteitalea pratensis TaxID=1855912 RepID=A0A143PNZ4_LUTPR|nr:asparaginase domain-containing protein [Luteitalea pratensis]AMY09514.1 putative L-asparaginase [Luteitalea pratensis]
MSASARAVLMTCAAAVSGALVTAQAQSTRPRIAVFSGPNATIQNNKPLVTSNKAREQYGLPLRRDASGQPLVDWPRYQRLAAPVTIYVEMFTAHPLESDARDLYAPPDGYVDTQGMFSQVRRHVNDKPVYVVTLRPEDGLYALPYMGRRANGAAWESPTRAGARVDQSRQTFVPDASRIFEEIERNGGEIRVKADYDFYRAVPAGGYTKGLAKAERTDVGDGDIPAEQMGVHFFAYGSGPYSARAGRPELARAANMVQRALVTGHYAGALWLEGSPTIEDTAYWLSLMVDTTLPIVACAAHRDRGTVSADGDGNIIDAIDFILSKVWADDRGRDRLGSVMVQDEVVFSGREVQKGDAHPGGYLATGGYGGILGSMTAGPFITNVPTRKHTWSSDVRVTAMPMIVEGLLRRDAVVTLVPVRVKTADGELVAAAIPRVIFVKGDHWYDDGGQPDRSAERGIAASVDILQAKYPLAGIVAEGLAPYAALSASQEQELLRAVYRGVPVVKAARGNATGLVRVNPGNVFIEGNNLTATKARLLLTAAIMKLGALPAAADIEHPTPEELDAIRKRVAAYQEIFQSH